MKEEAKVWTKDFRYQLTLVLDTCTECGVKYWEYKNVTPRCRNHLTYHKETHTEMRRENENNDF